MIVRTLYQIRAENLTLRVPLHTYGSLLLSIIDVKMILNYSKLCASSDNQVRFGRRQMVSMTIRRRRLSDTEGVSVIHMGPYTDYNSCLKVDIEKVVRPFACTDDAQSDSQRRLCHYCRFGGAESDTEGSLQYIRGHY